MLWHETRIFEPEGRGELSLPLRCRAQLSVVFSLTAQPKRAGSRQAPGAALVTIVVTVKINDGIVLAADSATTFSDDFGSVVKIYNSANKLFNLRKGLPIGSLTFGAGGIGRASIATISKDLRRRLSGDDPNRPDWKLDPDTYTIEQVARRAREFFFEELYKDAYGDNPPRGFFFGYKVCGYSAGAPLPELWDVRIVEDQSPEPNLVHGQESWGPNWDGEYEAMDRLIFGVGSNFRQVLINQGVPEDQASAAMDNIIRELRLPVVLPAMPIQDAIELAKFMVETTIRFVRFNLRSETVGGPIELAVITKHEGFRWVQRKLFFTTDLNQ